MTDKNEWQGASDEALLYEEQLVPALFAAWAPRVAGAASIGAGDQVLDVGCGTGVLAREAYRRVGPTGRVTGLDLNEGMLAVARRRQPAIDWRQGDALQLPFDSDVFEVVVSQFALMYFAHPAAGLQEMQRVLVPGGRLALAVWGPFERASASVILAEIAERYGGEAAAGILKAPHSLGDRDKLRAMLNAAGLEQAEIELQEGRYVQPSLEMFIETEVKSTPLSAMFAEATYQRVLAEAADSLGPYLLAGGSISVPMDAFIISWKAGS